MYHLVIMDITLLQKQLKKVYDNEGKEVKSFSTDDRKQVIKDSTAYIMTSMLRNVVNGTAKNAKNQWS